MLCAHSFIIQGARNPKLSLEKNQWIQDFLKVDRGGLERKREQVILGLEHMTQTSLGFLPFTSIIQALEKLLLSKLLGDGPFVCIPFAAV